MATWFQTKKQIQQDVTEALSSYRKRNNELESRVSALEEQVLFLYSILNSEAAMRDKWLSKMADFTEMRYKKNQMVTWKMRRLK